MTMRLAVVLLTLSLALPVLAQERATEESSLTHVFDETPQWEVDGPMIAVRLEAPADLSLCRQGRIAVLDRRRDAHMGCWPATVDGFSTLSVPEGAAYLAIRRGVDLTWLGGGATTLHAGDGLRVAMDDRLGIRIAGWVTAAVGVVVGAVLISISFLVRRVQTELAITGAAVAVVGLAVGIGLASVGDGFQLTLVPPTPPPEPSTP